MAFPFDFWMTLTSVFAGIGMDTCVIPLRHGGLSLVQTTDYIYPIVDDPYMMVSLTSCVFTSGAAVRLVVGCGRGFVYVCGLFVFVIAKLSSFHGCSDSCSHSNWICLLRTLGPKREAVKVDVGGPLRLLDLSVCLCRSTCCLLSMSTG